MKKQLRPYFGSELKLNVQRSKILVIENDPILCELLEKIFEEEGWEYRFENEVTDIIPLVEEFKPDLVLLDYMLPLVNGGELCSQIKRSNKFVRIPVIMYSAYSRVLLSIGDYGCDAFIEKPFELEELLLKMKTLISRYRKSINRLSNLVGYVNLPTWLNKF